MRHSLRLGRSFALEGIRERQTVMKTSTRLSVTSEMQAVSEAEMQVLSGGSVLYTDLSGMPDRTVTCGTMWYQQLLQKIFLPR
jgi:hypothetical protein